MARYTGAVCKLCRRQGMKLYLKGERCYTEKCPVARERPAPGQHGAARVKLSEYGIRLREKQKVRKTYGIVERQFAGYFAAASAMKGSTGENMLSLLERRLDNVVHRLGFGASRAQARQLVLHCHITVNGKLVNVPSFRVKVGDVIEVHEGSRQINFVQAAIASADKRPVASWLEAERAAFKGTVKGLPVREELNEPAIKEQYIIEYYSR